MSICRKKTFVLSRCRVVVLSYCHTIMLSYQNRFSEKQINYSLLTFSPFSAFKCVCAKKLLCANIIIIMECGKNTENSRNIRMMIKMDASCIL